MTTNPEKPSPADRSQTLRADRGRSESDLPPWPLMTSEMIEAVSDVLRSGHLNYWTGGECRAFENRYAEAIGVPHAIAVANGTLALELALFGLGLQPGDEIIVPARTFIATASAVVARGGIPVVADVDPISQNVTADTVEAVRTDRTRGVIVVHLGGRPCEMDPLVDWAASHGMILIEDCAQAHGASYRGRPVGSFGDAAAFSFCQDKIITTGGEGGLVVTPRDDVWQRMWSYKDHGKSYAKVHEDAPGDVFRFIHDRFGSNYRMTEMQAAIGQIALRDLPEWVKTRRRNAATLQTALAGCPGLEVPPVPDHLHHSYYRFYVMLEPERLRPDWTRDRIVSVLKSRGVPCGSGVCPNLTREEAFRGQPTRIATRLLPGADDVGARTLMFLVHPTLEATHLHRFADVIREVFTEATTIEPGRRSA